MDIAFWLFIVACSVFVGWCIGDLESGATRRRLYNSGYQDGYNQCRDDARYDSHGR